MNVKSQANVETADLLGLGELSATKFSKENPSAKQAGKGDKGPSSQPVQLLEMRPSHPSISTARKVETVNIAKGAPPPLPTPAATAFQIPQAIPQPIMTRETAQDYAQRIDRGIAENEKKLSEMKAIGYVPPHLRPAVRKPIRDSEDIHGSYIPPHLRKPREIDGRARLLNPTKLEESSQAAALNKPQKVSVVVTPISRAPRNPIISAASVAKATQSTSTAMPPWCHDLTPTQTPKPVQNNPALDQDISTITRAQPAFEHPQHTNPKVSRQNLPSRRAASPPPPVGGTKIRTAYFPLRPETPPPPSNNRNDGISSYGHQDGYSSYRSSYTPNDSRSFYQDGDRDNKFMLDHVATRKMKSYTRYRAKPGFAPHHPRLPFEFLHKIYGQSGATYTATLAERLHSSSVIGPRSLPVPGKTYGRPSTPQAYMIPDDLGQSYIIPEHENAGGYDSTSTSSSSSVTPTITETDDLVFTAWPQPQKRVFNEQNQKARSVILSGLPKIPTLQHVSRACTGSGRIEEIQINKKRRMAMVTFVESLTARHFFENTNPRGISLVYNDEETNEVMRQRIYVDMNPEVVAIERVISQVVEAKNGSRVLEVIGWTREILEALVGGLYEGAGVGYSDLLMRLASRYCSEEKVDRIDWRQDEEGQMVVTLMYAGIRDAMTVRDGLEKEPAFRECDIVFVDDP